MAKQKRSTKSARPLKDAPRMCLCGCGGITKPKRSFLPGHDMKLKGLVRRVQDGKANRSEIPSHAWPLLQGKGVGGVRLRRAGKARLTAAKKEVQQAAVNN